jgi:hypothetical protein
MAAAFVVLMLSMITLALDLGYVVLVRTQLQVAADSAVMAATAANMNSPLSEVVATAQRYAGFHAAGGKNIDLNAPDIELGKWDFGSRIFTPSALSGNAVRVTTRRDATANGESALFFARAVGIDSVGLQTEAIAAYVDNFTGFKAPSTGENLPFLPLALDKPSGDGLLAGIGTDNWTWDAESGQVTPGPDGIPELNFYPQDTGAPGNRGTVNIGTSTNSTRDLSRQILEGINNEDLSYHGGKLELDWRGELELGGNTGISAGIKDELEAIKGKALIVSVFSRVTDPGDNARYTIVEFMGVRIMEVELTETIKRVMIQPADVVVLGGIPASSNAPTQTSHSIFSPVSLVR